MSGFRTSSVVKKEEEDLQDVLASFAAVGLTEKKREEPSVKGSAEKHPGRGAVLVDDVSICAGITKRLLLEGKDVAIDIEGIDLCRIGEICIIIQMCQKVVNV
jgi:hypothetical protein